MNRNKIGSRKSKIIPNAKHMRNGRIKHWSKTLSQKQFQTVVHMNRKIRKSRIANTIQQRHNTDNRKKDKTVKLALDSKKINKFTHKKYQMTNLDLLLNNIAQVVKSDKTQQTLFYTLDLRYVNSRYVYSQTSILKHL